MTDFNTWLNLHDKEFLLLRLSGVGFDVAMRKMEEEYEKERLREGSREGKG